MFLHEAWIDITKEKPPNLSFASILEEHYKVLVLTAGGDIFLATPHYADENGYWVKNTFGKLRLYTNLHNAKFLEEDGEEVTHWMLLDNLYKKGKA
jgi:hypothetical protein